TIEKHQIAAGVFLMFSPLNTGESAMLKTNLPRRRFLTGAVAAAATVAIVPRNVLGGPGVTPPSETITRAVVGTGSQGNSDAHVLKNKEGATAVTLAVCDVDKPHLENALKKAGGRVQGYSDFRRVLDRKDIDTV